MMRKTVVICLMLMFTAGVYGATQITDIVFTGGGSASYDGAGTLTWGNANGVILLGTSSGFQQFDTATLNFNFDLANDLSGVGGASAQFTLDGDWSMTLSKDWGGVTASMTFGGSMYTGGNNPFGGYYLENADTPNGPLDGSAWLNVESSYYSINTHWGTYYADTYVWSADNIIGLDATITSLVGTLADYDTDGYTGELAVTLWDDQSNVVPEPATMVLLGLGGLLLRKRRA